MNINKLFVWLRFWGLSFLGLIYSTLSIPPALAVQLQDMVLVPHGRGFYMDIFETTFCEVENHNTGCDMRSGNWKPARMGFSDAENYCGKIGKRMPTVKEWMAAASNLGKNKKHTLVDDSLYDAQKRLKVNIRGSESLAPDNVEKIGIDAIGTAGMTGNRYEWVIDPDASSGRAPVQCGGQYETKEDAAVELANICISGSALVGTATVRCVVDYSPADTVQLTQRVKGPLRDYLTKSQDTVPASLRLTSLEMDLVDILIPENRFTTIRDPGQPDLLSPPEFSYDEEF